MWFSLSQVQCIVDSVNLVLKQVPRNCRNSKWSSLTWHLAHSASAFVTNQLIWISLNQGANSTWWGRTRKVWGRTRHKVGANSKGRTRRGELDRGQTWSNSYRYFHTFPYKLKVKQDINQLYSNRQLHKGLCFIKFNSFGYCISLNKFPGANYLKFLLKGRALNGRKLLD